jgi:hypothetical protein
MRSFQIYRLAEPNQRANIERMELEITRLQSDVGEAEAKFNYWKKSLVNAADDLREAEDKLCIYLEKLEKEMTR